MYDVIVIGGGPGGYAAAIRASQLKGKVAIVEAKAMGGTCVLRGCIPSKVWMHAGALLETARKAGDFGLKLTVGELDFDAVVARKKGVSNDIAMGMAALLQNNGVEVVNGRGRLVAPGKVDVDGNVLEAKSVIVATGSQLKKCDVPGADAIVMAGGIGENAAELREQIVKRLGALGVKLDKKANKAIRGGKSGLISTKDSKIPVIVIPTNEELMIARETVATLR